MKLRYLATVVIFALTTVSAHAQVGLYLNPIATRVSNSVVDSGPYAFLGANSTARTFWGVNIGGYDDLFHATNGVSVGVDVRVSDEHANNASIKNALIGVRVSAKPFTRPFKPYLQGSFGAGYTKAPTSAITVRKIEYGIFGGVDYTLQRHIDLRAVEVGYSSVETISSATVGGGGNIAIPASKLLNVSTGLVFRF